jgi:hypothetical protein
MAIFKQGSATTIGTKYATPQPSAGGTADFKNLITQANTYFLRVRVLDVVLNNNHPKFSEVGEWNGIGCLYFEPLDGNTVTSTYAYPIFPQIKMYPLVNEIILLAAIPSRFSDNEQTITLSYYYFPPIGIWNHPHHNAYPKTISYATLQQNQQNDYNQVDDTYVRRIDEDPTGINLNFTDYDNPNQDTFVEKADIHPLLPFNGDIIYEGRWGNSIRFGSTTIIPQGAPQPEINNNWSSTGSNGDPITILRNGQPVNSTDEGWIPITEHIKNDLSSVYLTSYQKIPFSIANENFVSYTTPPTTPSQYIKPQIILNSDRIILNAKSDSILISGENSVGLSSNGSVNIEAKEIYLDGTDIRLGNKNASQSALKGDDAVDYLKILVNELKNITEALKTIQNWPEGTPVPNSTMLTVANSAQKVFENVHANLDSIKSNFIKLI